MRAAAAAAVLTLGLVASQAAPGQNALERLRREFNTARDNIEQVKDAVEDEDAPSPSNTGGPIASAAALNDPAAMAAECGALAREQPGTPAGQRAPGCEAMCRTVAQSTAGRTPDASLLSLCTQAHAGVFQTPADAPTAAATRSPTAEPPPAAPTLPAAVPTRSPAPAPAPATATTARAGTRGGPAADPNTEYTSTGVPIVAASLTPDVVINEERAYRVYLGRANWCGERATFDVVYSPAGTTADFSSGGLTGLYVDMAAIKRLLCPAATEIVLNSYPRDRNQAATDTFRYRYTGTTETSASGVSLTFNEGVIGQARVRPNVAVANAPFSAYDPLFTRVYNLRPGMIGANDYRVSTLFSLYVDKYFEHCAAALPADSPVYEHKALIYAGSDYSFYRRTNYYREVVERRVTVRAELYDPYARSMSLTGQRIMADVMRQVRQSGGDAIYDVTAGFAFDKTAEILNTDLDRLFTDQRCDAPLLRDFERNAAQAMLDPPPPAPNQLALFEDRLEYTIATDDFSPELPTELGDAGGYGVYLRKEKTGRALVFVGLTRLIGTNGSVVANIRNGGFTPQQEALIDEDIDQIWVEGGALLTCGYENGGRLHWYRRRVPSADPARLNARVANHPLSYVREPLDRCPPQEPAN